MNVVMLIAAVFSLFSNSTPLPKLTTPLAGDYVEARTASVFAGACHYNGELVTTGGDAVMAWQFNSGSWRNADLSGVRVMAVVSSKANLGDAAAPRRSEIVIDTSATKAQADAVVDAIRAHEGLSLGTIVSIRRASISFRHDGSEYRVASPGFGAMDVQAMPNNDCCKQPNLVWYSPLVHLTNRKVGYTVNAAYTAGTLGEPWQRGDENGAFYGAFAY
jgi:hypothetical protein